LNHEALGKLTVVMRWAIFDVDSGEAHKTGKGITDGWRQQELKKVDCLLKAHSGLFVYFTRGGYRIVGKLPEEIRLTSREQAEEEWTNLYLQWVHYLSRVFGIEADPACANWNRMYRAPQVVRELEPLKGETKEGFTARQRAAKPENHLRFGSAGNIGTWNPALTEEDLLATLDQIHSRPAQPNPDEDDSSIEAGNGIFYELLKAQSLILKEVKSGKWYIRCPDADHGHQSKTGPTDSFVGAPMPGKLWGHIHCSHSNHCRWVWSDWKKFFSQTEIDDARRKLGLDEPRNRASLLTDTDDDLGLCLDADDAPQFSGSHEQASEGNVAIAVLPSNDSTAEPTDDVALVPSKPDLKLVVDNPNPEKPDRQWVKLLDIKKSKGKTELRPTRNNVELLLRNIESLKGLVCWNEITNRVCFAREIPASWLSEYALDKHIRRGTPWTDEHTHHLDSILSHLKQAIKGLKDETTMNAVTDVAMLNGWNPLREYFESLTWNGTPRAESWLIDYCHAEDTPYTRFVGPRWLLSAVARACNPGTKVDHTLMLEGEQGFGKSRALEVLGGEYYSHIDLGDLRNKESSLALQGVWILELAEGDILQRAHITALKAFTTKGFDDVVKKYSNLVTRIQRSTVFAVTINTWTDTLIDPTGNRRWWPVRVTEKIDIDGLQADRDQLWAEVYHLYKEGLMKWWPQTQEEVDLCTAQQKEREVEDAWLPGIQDIMDGVEDGTEIGIRTVLDHAVTMDVITKADRSKPSTTSKVGGLLRTLGWVRKHLSNGNVWLRGPEARPCTRPTTPVV
jgi:predicted P-loop ATPase